MHRTSPRSVVTLSPAIAPNTVRILVVACDPRVGTRVVEALTQLGRSTGVTTTPDTAGAFRALQVADFDLCVAPAADMAELHRQCAALHSWPALLAWNLRPDLDREVEALESGATAVVCATWATADLARSTAIALSHMARLRDVRAPQSGQAPLSARGVIRWTWDRETDEVVISPGGGAVTPTPAELLTAAGLTAKVASHRAGETAYFEERDLVELDDGTTGWTLSRGFVVRDEDGDAECMAGTLLDLAGVGKPGVDHRDEVTGLYNRDWVHQRLERDWLRQTGDQPSHAVLALDLDGFRHINEGLGHAQGDALLEMVASRMLSRIRPEDHASRLGADEFAVLLSLHEGFNAAYAVAQDILYAVGHPLELDGHPLWVHASAGLASGCEDHTQPEAILNDAQAALRIAKADPSQKLVTYRPGMRRSNLALVKLDAELHRAVERQQFCLHYQPIIELNTGFICGFEALVRWNHPKRGLVYPGDFIERVEENGLIIPLGRWILREACRQIRDWRTRVPAAAGATMAVNLSPRQFHATNVVEDVAEALSRHSLEPAALKLEITENTAMTHAESSIRQLQAFRDLGVQLQIDDFGTGYSSLNYLTRLPVDVLKVDRAFVSGLGTCDRKSKVVHAIIQLAFGVELGVVAEGIETPGQMQALQALGCLFAQGYLFARPAPPDQTIRLVGRDLRPVVEDDPTR